MSEKIGLPKAITDAIERLQTEAKELIDGGDAAREALKERIAEAILRANPPPHRCVYCEEPITGSMIGAGDGTGQKFAHPVCWRVATRADLLELLSPSKGALGGLLPEQRAARLMEETMGHATEDDPPPLPAPYDLARALFDALRPGDRVVVDSARRAEMAALLDRVPPEWLR